MKRKLLLILMLLMFITGCSNDTSNNQISDVRPEDTIFFKDNNEDIKITNEEEIEKLSTNSFVAKVNGDNSYTVISENNLKDGDKIVIITILDGNYIIEDYVYEEVKISNNINIWQVILIIIVLLVIIIEIIFLFKQNNRLKKLLSK